MKLITLNKIVNSNLEIELCPTCKGKGEIIDDSFGSGMTDFVICDSCHGTGRIKVIEAVCLVMVPFDFKIKTD